MIMPRIWPLNKIPDELPYPSAVLPSGSFSNLVFSETSLVNSSGILFNGQSNDHATYLAIKQNT
jgi:hypothetical protein